MSSTRREEIDNILRESELLTDIFDLTRDGILVVDENEIIAYSNAAAEKLLGISHDSMIGMHTEQIPVSMHYSSGKEIDKSSKPFAMAYRNGLTKGPRQVILKRSNGSTLPVFFNIRRKAKGITVAVLTDHSELMQRQQQADDYYNLLAHDMRTPLTVIQGHAELLKQNLTCDNSQIDSILDAGKQLEAMTKDMSDRIALESGNFILNKEETQVVDLVRGLISQLSLTEEKHRIEIDTPVNLSKIKADKYRIQRVISNIIKNAAKYSPPGTTISIKVWENDKAIMIKIADQGRGIEPEDFNYIFDPFFITSVGKEKGGTGLGLYIARLIVEAHNGRIYVSSDENGTSFAVHLPKAL